MVDEPLFHSKPAAHAQYATDSSATDSCGTFLPFLKNIDKNQAFQ